MNAKERFQNEIRPYVLEGLLREVFESEMFTLVCIANSGYCMYFHDEVDKETGLTWGFYLKGREFAVFMEDPTFENFKWLNYACQQRGEKRAILFTPQVAQKFRELKKRLDAENKVEVDLELEQQLVEAAKRKAKRRFRWFL